MKKIHILAKKGEMIGMLHSEKKIKDIKKNSESAAKNAIFSINKIIWFSDGFTFFIPSIKAERGLSFGNDADLN